jgi:two-component system chemotaxis response regulator CheY
MKTLIVEDDFTNRLLLQTFLSKYGDCHFAVNGKEAVAAFRSALEAGRPYDLVCMDVVMPEMDGHQAVMTIRALERARRDPPENQVKIIMTSALCDKDNVIKSAREECNAYLVKPIDTGKLLYHLKCLGLWP